MASPPPIDEAALVQVLTAEPSVVAAWLFGSRAAGTARPDSDVDVAVLLDAPVETSLWTRLALAERIREALGLPEGKVDLVDVDDAHPLVAHAAFSTGRLLVDRDPERRIERMMEGLHRAEEARHLLRIWREVRQEEARRGRT